MHQKPQILLFGDSIAAGYRDDGRIGFIDNELRLGAQIGRACGRRVAVDAECNRAMSDEGIKEQLRKFLEDNRDQNNN